LAAKFYTRPFARETLPWKRHLQAIGLLGAAFICLAFVLIAALMPRGGTPEDIAAHFSGPGHFPIVPPQSLEKANTALQR
jgi:hypothetical protein